MKTITIVFLFNIYLCYSQNNQKIIIDYLYKNALFFTDIELINSKIIKSDTLIFKKINEKKIIEIKRNNFQLISYLANNNKLFFILKEKNKINIIKKINYITKENSMNKVFPSDIIKYDFEKDSIPEVIVRFRDQEGPTFKIVVYKWEDDSIKKVLESKSYFNYPSWNPLINIKDIILTKENVIVPFCFGCQSGSEGIEKNAIIKYDKKNKIIFIKDDF